MKIVEKKIEEFAVEIWPLEKLYPCPKNHKKCTPEAIDKTAASIKRFGWQQVIVAEESGSIVAGHVRFLAATKLGLMYAPVKVTTGLTPEEVKAYRLADNRTGREDVFLYDVIGDEIQALLAVDFDISVTGFDEKELQSLLATECDVDFESAPEGELAEEKPKMVSLRLTPEQLETIQSGCQKVRELAGGDEKSMSDGRCCELLISDWLLSPNLTPEAFQ